MKTMLFNPYSGKPRDPRDIASDPSGILMLDPDEPMLAAKPPEQGRAADVAVRSRCVIYLDTDPIDVAQVYRAKGFQHLPPNPTMSGAEIRACGWKKNNYQMYIDVTPMKPIGDTEAIALEDGMKFFCIPPATW